jgi:hypothetical protein
MTDIASANSIVVSQERAITRLHERAGLMRHALGQIAKLSDAEVFTNARRIATAALDRDRDLREVTP